LFALAVVTRRESDACCREVFANPGKLEGCLKKRFFQAGQWSSATTTQVRAAPSRRKFEQSEREATPADLLALIFRAPAFE
jgi:hypothetical protein